MCACVREAYVCMCREQLGADPEIFLRGGPESTFCKMEGIHSNNVQH